MKRPYKIALIVLGIMFAVFAALFIGADVAVSRLVYREVNQALAALPGCEASCGPVRVRLFSGTAEVEDLRFAYHGEPVHKKDTTGPGIEVRVGQVAVGRVFYSLLLRRQVLVSDVHITDPQLELWLDDKHPESCFPKLEDQGLAKAGEVLRSAEVQQLHVTDAVLRLHSLRTRLDAAVDSCSLTLYSLAYDSVFSYCDSVYHLSVAHASVTMPDGRMRIDTRSLMQTDQGPLTLGATRIAHTMPRRRLGDMVKEPVTWMDMRLDSVSTSPFNPLRKALAQDYTIERVNAVVGQMDIFRDTRYKPKHPFPMPQTELCRIPVTFRVGQAQAKIQHINIELASTDNNCGKLHLGHISAMVQNITNRRNATMRINGSCPLESGFAKAEMSMTMNTDCDFSATLHAHGVDASMLNPFLRPLVGITLDMHIDTLDTRYTGNSVKANGRYRMLYHGLEIKVHRDDDIPYKIVTRNAGTINTLANSLLTKSNPTIVDYAPRAYKAEWKRDEWQPFPLYLFGPCIDGTVKTLLPGLNVHMQTR